MAFSSKLTMREIRRNKRNTYERLIPSRPYGPSNYTSFFATPKIPPKKSFLVRSYPFFCSFLSRNSESPQLVSFPVSGHSGTLRSPGIYVVRCIPDLPAGVYYSCALFCNVLLSWLLITRDPSLIEFMQMAIRFTRMCGPCFSSWYVYQRYTRFYGYTRIHEKRACLSFLSLYLSRSFFHPLSVLYTRQGRNNGKREEREESERTRMATQHARKGWQRGNEGWSEGGEMEGEGRVKTRSMLENPETRQMERGTNCVTEKK